MKLSITQNKRNRLLGAILWLLLWEIAYRCIDQAIYLPSPVHVIKSLITLVQTGDFLAIILLSSARVLASFLIAAISAVLLGLAAGLNRSLSEFFDPMIMLLRSTPVISIIILAIIWLRSDFVPIFSGFLMCFPIIYTNMVAGIRQTDSKLIEMASLYRVPTIRVIRQVYLPSARSHLESGLTSAIGMSWKVISAAEVLSLPKYAIGSKLHDTKVYLEITELFAWTLVILIMSFLFNHGLSLLFVLTDRRRSSHDQA